MRALAHPHPTMAVKTAGAALAVAAALALGGMLAAGWLAQGPLLPALDQLHWLASYLCVVLLAYLGWHRCPDPLERRARFWFVMGSLCLLAGQCLINLSAWLRWVSGTLAADALFLLCGPCLTWALALIARSRLDAAQQQAVALDAAAFLVTTLACTLALFIPRQAGNSWLLVNLLAAYPLSFMAPTSLGLILLLKLRARLNWQALLLPIGTGLLTLLWGSWNLASLDLNNVDGSGLNMGLSLAALTMGVGLWAFRFDINLSAAWDRRCEAVLRMLPLLLVMLAALGVALSSSLDGVPHSTRLVVQIGAGCVVALSLVRQSLLLSERDRLVEAEKLLKQRESELEGKVLARTQELKLALQSAEHARAAAEAASRVKGEFLANMSHEIRTPLNGVIGFTQLARMTATDADQQRYLGNIQQASAQLLRLINDILDMAKIEAGKLSIEHIRFDLPSIMRSVVTLVAPAIEAKHLRLQVDLPASVQGLLWGDPLRIEQIVLNYVNNAIKFTEQGHVRIEASVQSETATHCWLKISVTDTGIGMDEASCRRVFAPFEQADNSTTRKFGGTGLGLAISKQLAAMMGGEVGVSSQAQQGSCFWFTVLAGKATSLDAPIEAPSPAPDNAGDAMRGKRVLLAEDNEINQALVCSILEQHGLTVRVARDGQQALDMWRKEPFDCILMDKHMPVMDGLAATELIRQAQGPRIPIIAMTASVQADDIQQCLSAGMDDFISKPFQIPKLMSTLRKWMSGEEDGQPGSAHPANWVI